MYVSGADLCDPSPNGDPCFKVDRVVSRRLYERAFFFRCFAGKGKHAGCFVLCAPVLVFGRACGVDGAKTDG